eukprot:4136343-Pleurochrysis_carterae.AAC.1
MADDRIDVVALQELNLHRQNSQTVEAHKRTAQTLGYNFFLATTTEQKQTGGTAILVSQKLLSEGCAISTVIRHPDGNSIRVRLNHPTVGMLHLWSIYAPADGTKRRDFFLKIAAHVTPQCVLMGNFNCVEDTALDTRRSANSPYENTGADIITYIRILNKL